MKNVAEAVIKNNITFRQLRQKKSKNIPLMKGVLQNLTLIRQHALIQITFHYFRWTQTTYSCKIPLSFLDPISCESELDD